jgi:hypothetical protein
LSVQTPAFKCFGYGDKKNPTTLGGQSHGAKFFSGGFEEGCFKSACHSRPLIYLQIACHNNPSMFLKYRVLQEKYTWGFVKNEPLFHENQLCKDTVCSQKSCSAGHRALFRLGTGFYWQGLEDNGGGWEGQTGCLEVKALSR